MIKIPQGYRQMIYTNSEETKGGVETFLLTRTAMISENGDNTILVQAKKRHPSTDKLRELAITEDDHTDEGFTTMIISKDDLEKAIQITGVIKRRRKQNTKQFDNLKEFYCCDIFNIRSYSIGFKKEALV